MGMLLFTISFEKYFQSTCDVWYYSWNSYFKLENSYCIIYLHLELPTWDKHYYYSTTFCFLSVFFLHRGAMTSNRFLTSALIFSIFVSSSAAASGSVFIISSILFTSSLALPFLLIRWYLFFNTVKRFLGINTLLSTGLYSLPYVYVVTVFSSTNFVVGNKLCSLYYYSACKDGKSKKILLFYFKIPQNNEDKSKRSENSSIQVPSW